MSECITDNRFEIIARAKQALLDSTNIDTSPDEMACLNNFLFRCWQMGWLDKYEKDLVEVVRCKDCKRGGWRLSGLDNKTKGYRCAIHAVLGFDFGDNGYCSYGERESDE